MTPPTPPTPATTPDDDLAGIVSLIRQRAKALLDDGFTTAAESDVIDAPLALRVADHLESLAAARSALAACRAALDGTEGMLWTLSETLDRDEQALPLRRLVDAKRQAIKAALADADRAGAEGG
jgi:glutathione S-transferase